MEQQSTEPRRQTTSLTVGDQLVIFDRRAPRGWMQGYPVMLEDNR